MPCEPSGQRSTGTDLPTGPYIFGEWLTGGDTRSRGTLQALDPSPRLFEGSVRALYALVVMRYWMRSPDPRVVDRSSRTLTGLHVDGQAHSKRRHRLLSHDAMLPRNTLRDPCLHGVYRVAVDRAYTEIWRADVVQTPPPESSTD